VGDEAAAPRLLGELTWTELDAERRRPLLVVPCGSTEQHGPHLPLDTDTRIAVALAHRLAAAWPAVVGPAVAFGASGEHQDFAGTVSIGSAALATALTELVRSVRGWSAGVVLLSAHGGNAEALGAVAGTAAAEGDRVLVWAVSVPGGDAHAGRTETSLLLALDPCAVRWAAAAPGVTAPVGELWPRLRRGGVRSVSENGVLGDPTGATADEGRRVLDDLCRRLVAAVDDWVGRWAEPAEPAVPA
jgi:mycofactocin system creatininase family protein